MADIDLRPKQGEPLYEVLRLGMIFDHVDGDGLYTFTRNADNLVAEFKGMDATEIKFIDRTTTMFLKVPIAEVGTAEAVLTWQGKNPTLAS
jgi:hypothetical protein